MESINSLVRKGVKIPAGAGIEIGPEVDLGRISGEGVVIHPGCRIRGERTLILPGARLGSEAPVTIENCLIGPDVELKGGYFSGSVFLEKSSCGSGAHVREGTILEEGASIAHTVGLKQTILFPFVTLGSLINFCDCLMAGGTGPKNHSEVGSSYIHFNFTPTQHKATASLIGDVPRGVMLNCKPIFLGGQGGIVGPVRLEYGLTAAAGTILRRDELRPDRLIFGGAPTAGNVQSKPWRFQGIERVIRNNIIYIGNLMALRQWHLGVRSMFVAAGRFPEELLAGLVETVEAALSERLKRLKELMEKLAQAGNGALSGRFPAVEDALKKRLELQGNTELRKSFLEKLAQAVNRNGKDYIAVIQALDPQASALGTEWLQGIVDGASEAAWAALK
jgi:UDP-N-acetylglucosamine/UDP-N-acetylgalactosamine diphosphorylase